MHITVEPLSEEQKKKKYTDESQLGFGKLFTDRMFMADWYADKGWINPRIVPWAPFVLEPSCLVFHYGQEIFEGLKAYKWADGSLGLFRPEMNARRFNRSADRMCMPEVPEELFLAAVKKLVDLERDWVPSSFGTALYIRPTMIAVEPVLGVKPSSHYYFYIILSPVGAYYASGVHPIKILVEDKYVRATPGGTGEAKTGGNYASSLKATLEAKKRGFEQVLWLDSLNRRYIEEVGAMNMFFVYRDHIVTAPLAGSILHGITRDSLIELMRQAGHKVHERHICINELMQDIRDGKVVEAFGTGTAAVITPVNALCYRNETVSIGGEGIGPLVQKFYTLLTDIQYGRISETFGWMQKI